MSEKSREASGTAVDNPTLELELETLELELETGTNPTRSCSSSQTTFLK